ncbi:MAG: tRNA (guanosine(37)-N1)-methyltransferase TrmD [bacterium]|nr:tRNA (guanosine(37)-N1)-methyltransferase TrmD [bacterium]
MKISVITIFPEFFDSPLDVSLVGRARSAGIVDIEVIALRAYGLGRHQKLDGAPFGGGAGLVMRVEPLAAALEALPASHKVLLSAAGHRLTQATLDRFAGLEHVTLVCGRYEGVDERAAEHLMDEEVSLGDYVLLGGEVGALAIIEGVVRLLPGVVGNPESVINESFREGLVEEPQYTRPVEFRGWEVPEVLRSGNHERVAEWRRKQRERRTRQRRPDLWRELAVDDEPE